MIAVESHDILTIGTLALLEGILSVDNALVLAILVRDLPEKMRKNAMWWGMMGAVVFRIFAVIFASVLIQFETIKLIGGAYLIYLAIKHMFFGLGGEDSHGKKDGLDPKKGFIKVVLLLLATDLVFSIDSITTALAFSDKLWVLWFGGISGIILMRFASGFFVKALERFPKLEDLAYQLVFFVGTKLSLETLGVHIEHIIFWVMMMIIGIIGASLIVKDHKMARKIHVKSSEIIEKLKAGEISVAEALSHDQVKGKVLVYLYENGFLEKTNRQ